MAICIQKLRKLALRLEARLDHYRASMRAYLAKKGEQRKDISALEPVKCFSADARIAPAGKPAKSSFHHGTLIKDTTYDFADVLPA